MKLDAKMVNLLGLLVIVAVLGLGTISMVMPIYEGVQDSSDQLETVEQTNDTYRIQLAQLTEAEGRKSEIEKSVEKLRQQLPATVQADSALQVIAAASEATGAFIDRDAFTVATPFAPRTGAEEEGAAQAEAAPAPPADPGTAAEGASEATETDADATVDAGTEVPAEPPADPRQQVEIELVLSVQDTTMATAFLDALRAGPRSVLVTSAVAERGSAHVVTGWEGTLTVKLLVFFSENGAAK